VFFNRILKNPRGCIDKSNGRECRIIVLDNRLNNFLQLIKTIFTVRKITKKINREKIRDQIFKSGT
jgi:hypothetical protein